MPQNSYMHPPRQAATSRKWHHIDAKGLVLGRIATKAADLLRGKGKATYTDYVDCGDFVVVTNCKQVKLTGNKIDQKTYFSHSGFAGGAKVMRQPFDVANVGRIAILREPGGAMIAWMTPSS